MANGQSLIVTGGLCRLYVNNKVFSVAQSVEISSDLGTYSIYGINSIFPQEIVGSGGQNIVRGNVRGVRVKNSGGLQGSNLIALFQDSAATNYCSLRLEDRSTGETIWSAPKAMVSNITESIQTKGIYLVSFTFLAQILYWPLDLS